MPAPPSHFTHPEGEAVTELLLEATGIQKRYGAVSALSDASLAVRPGEIHALMGANGAGKSTLVKILTGAVRPDGGTIRLHGQQRVVHSPAEARRSGMVSVYQEPAIIPDLTVGENLTLTETPVEAFRARIAALGISKLDLRTHARDLPLATLRIIDLARALAIEPDVLLLDEMTAALPADLTARVLDVVAEHRGTSRSVIFISHRMLEVEGLCDRATVLREGSTVGVVDIAPGSGAQRDIVKLMLGPAAGAADSVAPTRTAVAEPAQPAVQRLSARSLGAARNLIDVSFDLHAGEVLGIVALEGQGQDGSSTSSPARPVLALARCLSTASPCGCATRLTRSARGSSSSRRTAHPRCSCSDPYGRTSACRGSRPCGAGAYSTWEPREGGSLRRSSDSGLTPARRPRRGACREATSRR